MRTYSAGTIVIVRQSPNPAPELQEAQRAGRGAQILGLKKGARAGHAVEERGEGDSSAWLEFTTSCDDL